MNVVTGGSLTLPASAIDTGTANLTLAGGGSLTTGGSLRGTSVTLSSGGPMTIGHDITALGPLGLASNNAPISQTAGSIIAVGPTTVNAGSGDVSLARAGNDFQAGVSVTGGAIDLHDANDLTIVALANGVNRSVSLVAGGSLVLPATPIATGSADLTLQALGGALAITGNLSGNNVTVSGSTGLTLGANVTSSGTQSYTTPLVLTANVALDAGSSKIDLLGGANGGGHDLTLTSTNAASDAIHNGAALSSLARLAVNGRATLGGNVTTSVSQTYAQAVQLGVDTTFGGTGNVVFNGTVDSVAGLHRNLVVTAGGSTAFAGAVGATQAPGTVSVAGPARSAATFRRRARRRGRVRPRSGAMRRSPALRWRSGPRSMARMH